MELSPFGDDVVDAEDSEILLERLRVRVIGWMLLGVGVDINVGTCLVVSLLAGFDAFLLAADRIGVFSGWESELNFSSSSSSSTMMTTLELACAGWPDGSGEGVRFVKRSLGL